MQKWLPLNALYIPQRDEVIDEVRIDPLTPAESTIELIRYAFSVGQHQRFSTFANITRRIAVKRLIYPAVIDKLPQVGEAILRNVWAK